MRKRLIFSLLFAIGVASLFYFATAFQVWSLNPDVWGELIREDAAWMMVFSGLITFIIMFSTYKKIK